jgi:hypothetical protein
LVRALAFLEAGETKAAAVHVRSKFEEVIKNACARLKVPIAYDMEMDKATASTYWSALRAAELQFAGATQKPRPSMPAEFAVVDGKLAERISHSLSWVMNPLSHSATINYYSAEIRDAIYAVEELECQINQAMKMRHKPHPRLQLIWALQDLIRIRR